MSWVDHCWSKITTASKKTIFAILPTFIGGASDGAQTFFIFDEFWKNIILNPTNNLLGYLSIVSGFMAVVRFIQSLFLEFPNVKKLFQDCQNIFTQPKKFCCDCGRWVKRLLSLPINIAAASIVAMGTVVGFFAAFGRKSLWPLYAVLGGIDAFEVIATEGSSVKKVLKKMRGNLPGCSPPVQAVTGVPSAQSPCKERKYYAQTAASKAVWWLCFFLSLARGTAEVGYSLLIYRRFFDLLEITMTPAWMGVKIGASIARGVQNIAYDGVLLSDFFAKMVDKKMPWHHRRMHACLKPLAIALMILGAIAGGVSGYIGMQELASSWVLSGTLSQVLSIIVAVISAIETIPAEAMAFIHQVSYPSKDEESSALLKV